ncbi:hypothetical protein I4U23_004540 [Adineta vaga]|nr:hypothetical protein I4U23_004540 [Adineta vaga]
MSQVLNLYELLGIEANATLEVIRQAWRRRILVCHPDKCDLDSGDRRQMFLDIQRAYETLSNDRTRRMYDEALIDDDEENIADFMNRSRLQTGTRASQEFEKKIKRWIDEYPTRTFIDNVDKEFSSITTELLDKHKHRLQHSLLKKRCDVCYESFSDLTVHREDKKNILDKFIAQHSGSTLDEYLQTNFPIEWNWKPISDAPKIIQELWLSPKWSELKSLIDSVAEPIKILKSAFVKKSFNIDESIRSIVRSVLNISPIDVLPNISELIGLIDYENRKHESPFFKNWTKSRDNDYRVSGTVCVVNQTDNMQILGKLHFRIEEPRMAVPKTDCTSCEVCKERFNMLLSKHRCRMCSKIQCDNCQVWQTCRPYGFLRPVRICLPCSQRQHTFLCKVLHAQIERLIIEPYSNNMHIYLALLQHYDRDRAYQGIYQRACRYYRNRKEFSYVLQCYRYFATDQDWIQLAEQLCTEHSAFEFAAKSFASISPRSNTYWTNRANTYFEQNQPKLALLCYHQANLSIDSIWLALTSIINDEAQLYISYYIQGKVEKMTEDEKTKWINQLRQYLIDEKLRSFSLRQLQLINLSTSDWKDILEKLSAKQQYVVVAEILLALHPYSQEYIHPFLQSVSTFLRNSAVQINEWINVSVSVDQMIMNMAFIHHLIPYLNWEDLRSVCLDEKKLIAAILCHKVRASLHPELQLSTRWIEDGISNDEPIAYELKRLISGKTWKQLAAECTETDQLHSAMHYNYLRLQDINLIQSTIQSVIKFTEDFLSADQTLRCILATYKKVKNDVNCFVITIEYLLKYCQASETKVNIIARAASSIQMPKHLISLYTMLLDELRKSKEFFEPYDACLHHVAHTEKVQDHIKQHPVQVQAFVKDQLKLVLHQSILFFTRVLAKTNNIDVIEQILCEYFNERTIANASDEFRAKMWLITGIRDKLQNQYVNAVGCFQKALACYPSDETNTALVLLLQDAEFTATLLVELLLSLNEMNLDTLAGFGCDIEPPPTTFIKDNCLRASANSTFIRRYERAVLEQRNGSSLRTALSYIDMCNAIHDPTMIVSNLLLAGIHFYNLLLRPRTSPAFVYAYRQSIEQLCQSAFYYGIHYLSPPIQIYAYRLMITLLCRANSVLRTVSRSSASNQIIQEEIISKQSSGFILRLFNRTIHLSEVSPLMNIPISLSYDVLYHELISEDFLIDYLNAMSKNQVQSIYYQYYVLEGMWVGWIKDRTLSNALYTSMEILLQSKQWSMFDVQALFQACIVPRTLDGWLYRDRMPLLLTKGEFCFQRADGISVDLKTGQVQFLFQPAVVPDDGLFDEKDVAEVLRNGLTDTLFSLDQPEGDLLYHPFQQMRYKPQTLLNTRYLATMLHTDYLLKMFSSETEISTKIPFNTRPITDGFFQRLPEHLRAKLRPLNENRSIRNNQGFIGHRFWIQPDDTTFETRSARDSTNQFLMRVGNIKLRVRKRRLVPNERGILVDDDDENLDDQQSPESQFAKAFTENYDEIGTYFPEFLRLKELIKLGVILEFIRTAYNILKQPVSVNSLSESLKAWRREIKYPYATYANEIQEYNECLAHNWCTADQVSASEEHRVKSEIRTKLEGWDEKVVSNCADSICKACHSDDTYAARSLVKRWLENNQNDSLASFMANSLNNHNKKRLKPIEQMHIKFDDHEDGDLNLHVGIVPINAGVRPYNALVILRSVSTNAKLSDEKYQSMKGSHGVSPVSTYINPKNINVSKAKPAHNPIYNDSMQNNSSKPSGTEKPNNTTSTMTSKIIIQSVTEQPIPQTENTQNQSQNLQKANSHRKVSPSVLNNVEPTELWMACDSFKLFQCLKDWLQNYEPEGMSHSSPLIQAVKRKYLATPVTNATSAHTDIPITAIDSTHSHQDATVEENSQMTQSIQPDTISTSSSTVDDNIQLLRRSNDLWLREYKMKWLENHALDEAVEQSLFIQETDDDTDNENIHTNS